MWLVALVAQVVHGHGAIVTCGKLRHKRHSGHKHLKRRASADPPGGQVVLLEAEMSYSSPKGDELLVPERR